MILQDLQNEQAITHLFGWCGAIAATRDKLRLPAVKFNHKETPGIEYAGGVREFARSAMYIIAVVAAGLRSHAPFARLSWNAV